jgi:hypothetical protein
MLERSQLASLFIAIAVAACASTGVTVRSNHFRLALPPDWAIVESGGGEIPTLIRAPSNGGEGRVDIRVYTWIVSQPPADATSEVLERLSARNVVGLPSSGVQSDEPCADRADQFFVFGRPAGAVYRTDAEGRRIVIAAGEAYGSLVALVGAQPPGVSGCAAGKEMDAVIERLAASMTPGADFSHPMRPPTMVDPSSGIPFPPPDLDPAAPP